jgi:hypothetical protein
MNTAAASFADRFAAGLAAGLAGAPIATCPKCGRSYSHLSWRELPVRGVQADGAGGELELRNCSCGDTLSIAIEVRR